MSNVRGANFGEKLAFYAQIVVNEKADELYKELKANLLVEAKKGKFEFKWSLPDKTDITVVERICEIMKGKGVEIIHCDNILNCFWGEEGRGKGDKFARERLKKIADDFETFDLLPELLVAFPRSKIIDLGTIGKCTCGKCSFKRQQPPMPNSSASTPATPEPSAPNSAAPLHDSAPPVVPSVNSME